MNSEWGSSEKLRFVDPESVRMYDSEGNVMLCKCGKPASSGIMGKEAYQVWCKDCSPMSKYEGKLVYRGTK